MILIKDFQKGINFIHLGIKNRTGQDRRVRVFHRYHETAMTARSHHHVAWIALRFSGIIKACR